MKDLLTNLMANPYLWVVLSISTLIGIPSFIFTIVTWIRGKKRLEISYHQQDVSIVTEDKQKFPELSVSYADKSIDSLSISTFTIWNSGNAIINKSDLPSSYNLKIKSEGVSDILEATITQVSDIANGCNIVSCKEKEIVFDFDYFDIGDAVRVDIIHTGKADALKVFCKIKGAKEPKESTNYPRKEDENRIYELLSNILVGGVSCIMTVTGTSLIQDSHLNLTSLILFILAIIVLLIIFLVKKIFTPNLPKINK